MKPKVILIGLDGATWELIKPWADEGKLPTFKNLMDIGAWGKLESTIPPVTLPAWQSLFTGMNPGKLGVFDFVQLDIKQQKYRINSPKSFHKKRYAIWNILSDFGYRCAVINIPTAQVASINGVMVGGAFSFKNSTYPKNFQNILNNFGYERYPKELIKSFIEASRESSNSISSHKLIEIAKNTFDSRFNLAKYLLRKEKPDFLAFVLFCIDNIQHFFWGEEIIEHLWKYLDSKIKDFLAELDDNTYVFVCSDHGFCEINKTFYISKYLEKKSYLRLKKTLKQDTLNLIRSERLMMVVDRLHLVDFLRKIINPEKLNSILSNFPNKQGRIGAAGFERIIDWKNSKCIPLSRGLYLNCPDEEKKKIIVNLSYELEHLEINGEKLIERVYTKEQIYYGKYLYEAPDLVLKPKEGVRVLESPYVKNIIKEGSNKKGWKGGHTPNGMFLCIGPEITRKNVVNAKIYDIAPTILHIFDLPIPTELDGNVLKDIFR